MTTIQSLYQQKLTTAEGVASHIAPGWVCCTDIGLGMPYALLNTIGDYLMQHKVEGVKIHTILDLRPLNCFEKEVAPYFQAITCFSGAWARQAVNGGWADVLPCYYRDMPRYFRTRPRMDALILTAAPMDDEGYFSIGINGSNTPAMLENVEHVFLEVNDHMPRALHAPKIHISQVTAFCKISAPLPSPGKVELDELSRIIGGYIADEVPDGSTIQLGIGAIPEAVGLALHEKHDLGIHTELLTDSMIELIRCGAVTNARKPIHTGKTVATLAYGSQDMYDYIHENDDIEFLPVDYTNDPAVIAQHPCFMSVNGALAVDFYGQVCAESLGTRHVSGTGGQADYVRGAVASPGGKSFIAFPSTTKNDTISRIGSVLPTGSIVSTSKNDVDYIVTEYGVARLRGKSLSQRAKELIAIAHPKFRDQLLYDAKKMNILI